MDRNPEIDRLRQQLDRVTAERDRLRDERAEILESWSWRLSAPLRGLGAIAHRLLGREIADSAGSFDIETDYAAWSAEFSTLTARDRRAITAHIARMTRRPLFDIVVEQQSSLPAQLYPNWRALTPAEAHAGTGDFITFLSPGDVLAEEALYEVAVELEKHPDAGLIYTDEDEIAADGGRAHPRFKTGWNPDLLLAADYMGQATFFRRSLLPTIDAPAYELKLRVSAALEASRIRHIPAVLCHRRAAARDVLEVRSAAQTFVAARGATVEPAPLAPDCNRIMRPRTNERVSIIIPTRDRADLLRRCLDGIFERTDYSNFEVIVIDHESREPATRDLLQTRGVRVLHYRGEFNWSAMNNAAARIASGAILLFLNNDVEVQAPGWLAEMAAHAVRPEIGAVGAKLMFGDGTIQHAGVWTGPRGVTRHPLQGAAAAEPGYENQLALVRNLSAVSGACMAVRTEVFRKLNGFDESLPVAYNDIDLCFRTIDAGYRVLWTPDAQLLHRESASRGAHRDAHYKTFRRRWQDRLDHDPFFNPNLDLDSRFQIVLANPPRRVKPWRR